MRHKQFFLSLLVAIISGVFCLCCFSNLAAQDTMVIGGVSLHLGMSKEEVTELLQGLPAESFKTHYDLSPNMIVISSLLPGGWDLAGTITFDRSDSVFQVSRQWAGGSFDSLPGAYHLGKAIYDALSSIGKDNATVALVETETKVLPQWGEYRTVLITVGNKQFSLGVPDADFGVSVTFEETLIAK